MPKPEHRSRLITAWALLAVVAASAMPVAASANSANESGPVAFLGAERIALNRASEFHCHDRDYPVIRCFGTAAERTTEGERFARRSDISSSGTSFLSPFVRWYRDASFGGPSFEAYLAEPDLAAVGWDNQISSFKSLNGGHPLWWTGANQSGTKWDWGTASVGSLGAGNDQFSSVGK